MSIYDDFQGLANDLLAEFGSEDAHLISVKPGGYDPASGKQIGGTEVTIPISAVFMEVKAWRVDGENVRAGDLIVKAGTRNIVILPKAGDMVRRGNKTYSVLGVQEVKPADTSIMFELHVRAD